MENIERTILHCDANNFYASVACYLDPTLKGKSVAVCGDPEKRHGIVLAKNEIAKSFGVSTGDTIWQAKLKCPNIVILKPQFDEYIKFSNSLFNLYSQYTDRVEAFGMDECWLDVTHSKIFGDGKQIADELRQRVKDELHITISAGVSFNKIFAKLASELKKPDGTSVITRENFKKIIFNKPASDLLMVGHQTNKTLQILNINTIGDLAAANPILLKQRLGMPGLKLQEWANGIDESPVALNSDFTLPKQISNSTTTYTDLRTIETQRCVLRSLCDLVATRLLHLNLMTTGIFVGLKFNDFSYFGKQSAIPATSSSKTLFEAAKLIFAQNKNDKPIRAITFAATKLTADDCIQLNIFDSDFEKNHNLDLSIDSIKRKYGYKTIIPASTLIDTKLCQDIQETDLKPFKH